jgi:hypothetical protein
MLSSTLIYLSTVIRRFDYNLFLIKHFNYTNIVSLSKYRGLDLFITFFIPTFKKRKINNSC